MPTAVSSPRPKIQAVKLLRQVRLHDQHVKMEFAKKCIRWAALIAVRRPPKLGVKVPGVEKFVWPDDPESGVGLYDSRPHSEEVRTQARKLIDERNAAAKRVATGDLPIDPNAAWQGEHQTIQYCYSQARNLLYAKRRRDESANGHPLSPWEWLVEQMIPAIGIVGVTTSQLAGLAENVSPITRGDSIIIALGRMDRDGSTGDILMRFCEAYPGEVEEVEQSESLDASTPGIARPSTAPDAKDEESEADVVGAESEEDAVPHDTSVAESGNSPKRRRKDKPFSKEPDPPIPQLDLKSGKWMTQTPAAKALDMKVSALKTARGRSIEGMKGKYGRDGAHREWRVDPDESWVFWYYIPSLNINKKS